ncbi:MAG: hypothetical protein WBY88_03800, partial [Desulfosarcina sp.]
MNGFRSKKIEHRILVFLVSFLMISPGSVVLAGSDRIFPTEKVTLYRGDQIVGVYTQEAPLPEGSFISTEGRCAVKLSDLYLVGEDGSLFSIQTNSRQRNLFVREGV